LPAHPKSALERYSEAMFTAILLTSSLLIMFAMCASLMWLAAVRVREVAPAAQAPETREAPS